MKYKERKLKEWEVSDEHGWRMIELWIDEDRNLYLIAIDKDGNEVSHNLF